MASTPPQRHLRRRLRGWRKGKLAYAYLRVSTNMSNQLSIPDQREICLAIAAVLGYTIIGWYIDEKSRGVRRTGLVQMLGDLESNGNVGAVFFWQASRVWGHVEQQRRIQYQAQTLGVRLIDGKGKEWKSDTPMEVLFNLISGGLNEFETSTTAERIHDTHSRKAGQGRIIQRPPFGVRSVKTVVDDQVSNSFVVDPGQMAIVRRIFNDYAAGTAAWKIAKSLSADGATTQLGSQFTAANIRRTLDNRFYIGEMIWNRTKTEWEIDPITGDKLRQVAYRELKDHIKAASPLGCILAENPDDPASVLAARDLFERCQDQRTTRGRERIVRKYDPRVLSGLIICGRCGYRMQARRFGHTRANGERSDAWDFRCQHATNANKGCSKSHSMTETRIHKKLRALVDGQGDDRLVKLQIRDSSGNAHKLLAQAQRDVQTHDAAIARIKKWARTDFYENDEEAEAEMRLAREARETALRALAEAEAITSTSIPVIGALSKSQRELLANLLDMIEDQSRPLQDRRDLAREAFESIRVNSPSIAVAWRA